MTDQDLPTPRPVVQRTLDAVLRIESARIIATLAKMTGDVGLTEDLAQEALIRGPDTMARVGRPG
jgi:predicted RNA polymerase sigma factor